MTPAVLIGLGGVLLAASTGLPPTGPVTESDRPPSPVRDDPVALAVNPRDGSAVLVLDDLLGGEIARRALGSGLPVRVRIVTELWRDRFVDSEEGRAEWSATVVHDPLAGEYRVEMEGTILEWHTVATLDEARGLLSRRVPLDLRPRAPGRYYYLARAEIETLSLSDLEELQRWLRGELAPAVEGEERVEGAVSRGLRRLFVRLLGAPSQRFQVRTPRFRYPLD